VPNDVFSVTRSTSSQSEAGNVGDPPPAECQVKLHFGWPPDMINLDCAEAAGGAADQPPVHSNPHAYGIHRSDELHT